MISLTQVVQKTERRIDYFKQNFFLVCPWGVAFRWYFVLSAWTEIYQTKYDLQGGA